MLSFGERGALCGAPKTLMELCCCGTSFALQSLERGIVLSRRCYQRTRFAPGNNASLSHYHQPRRTDAYIYKYVQTYTCPSHADDPDYRAVGSCRFSRSLNNNNAALQNGARTNDNQIPLKNGTSVAEMQALHWFHFFSAQVVAQRRYQLA